MANRRKRHTENNDVYELVVQRNEMSRLLLMLHVVWWYGDVNPGLLFETDMHVLQRLSVTLLLPPPPPLPPPPLPPLLHSPLHLQLPHPCPQIPRFLI